MDPTESTDQIVPEQTPAIPTPPVENVESNEHLENIFEASNDKQIVPTYSDDFIYELSDVEEDDEYTSVEREQWEARYAEAMKEFRVGELVSGKIVAISENDVTIDIGFKSEGIVSKDEFDNPEELKVGSDVEVGIERIENRAGTLVLSKRKAEFIRTWEKISDLYQTGEMIEAQIIKRIKGGMVVELYGIEAFLPGSQIDIHPVRDFDALVGVAMDFRVIKINNVRKNVVLSHKVLIEESLREIREKVLSALEVGQVVEGVVKNITDFGVFVDLGGVDGLLHITDLSWGRVSHPSEVVALDKKIKVKVLQYDKEKQRISLGLKQLNEPDWDDIESKYPVNSKIIGKVVAIVKYGAFIELEPGVEGLVHISEMSWIQHIKHPSQMVTVGQEVEVVVLSFERESRKISLGMKQIDEDPWERLEKVYLKSSRHKGLVRDLVPFGAFVELEPGIDGLIHISDLSWTRKVRHPGEIVKKGQEIEVIILNFDRNERRIALGFKQLEEDPWDNFEKEYQIRAKTEGSVIRVLEKGVVVMLPLGVEGFIPNSQLGRSLSGENKRTINDGDNLELEIIEFDKSNHRIVLSHSAIERGKVKSNSYRTSNETRPSNRATIGDLLRDPDNVAGIQQEADDEMDESESTIEDEKEESIPTLESTEQNKSELGQDDDKVEPDTMIELVETEKVEPESEVKKTKPKSKPKSTKTDKSSDSEVSLKTEPEELSPELIFDSPPADVDKNDKVETVETSPEPDNTPPEQDATDQPEK